MTVSIVSLCNRALYSIGVENPITSLDEGSAESTILNACYEQVRDSLLRAFPWGFALRIATLEEPSDETHPSWDYVYTYPSNCLRVTRLLTETSSSSVDEDDDSSIIVSETLAERLRSSNPIRFEIGATASGRRVYTDLEDAYAEYIYQETDPLMWDALFCEAFIAQLASEVCLALSGSDGKYADAVRRARAAYIRATATSAAERRNTHRRRNRYTEAR